MVTIIDFQAGNIASIKNMLKKLGAKSIISSNPGDISVADKLILPGVGAFDHGMLHLNSSGLTEAIKKRVLEGIPLLGICLGAQMLGNSSEEGQLKGLGLINMKVVKFDSSKLTESLKVPHMGWRDVVLKKPSLLFEGMYSDPRYYFVHSYHFSPLKEADILTTSVYGYEFASAVQYGNITGVQFHPEKSHKYGMKLFENFLKL